jgi:hypothetical protein
MLSGALLLLTFAAVLALRWSSDFSNVDDYLYARQTHDYLDALKRGPSALVDAWRAYGQNSPLVPLLATPIAAIDSSPHRLVLMQAIPLLVLFVSVSSILGSVGLGARARWPLAAMVASLPPLLAYAAMFHFGLAATALTALAAASYLRSERLQRRGPAVLLGVALGLLSVTRVVAPVYIAAIALAVAVDVLAGHERLRASAMNAALATLVAGLLAAPWWLTAGPTALDYVTSAGYGESPFTTPDESRLDIAWRRVTWTATETGWLLGVSLALLLALSIWALTRRQRGWQGVAWLLGAAGLAFAGLATSSNPGTGFALPVLVVVACAAVWAVAGLRGYWRAAIGAASCAVVVVSALALFEVVGPAHIDGRPLWSIGTPGIDQARSALGCRCELPDTERLSDAVVALIGERPTLLARDDAILNAESLRYRGGLSNRQVSLVPVPPNGKTTPRDLARIDYVVTGSSLGPYHANVDGVALLLSLRAEGFRRVLDRRLSRFNIVTVWARPKAAAQVRSQRAPR